MRSLAVLIAVLAVLPARADLRHYEDATLRSVRFVDGREGWAVGDEGVIWHTIDGGKAWERVSSGTRASLRSVFFLDPYVGWIVGREELPGGGSVGVVLYTCDQGTSWRRLMTGVLPGLHAVAFADARTGCFVGDGSAQFPTGVFTTTDGGKNWDPVPGQRTASWRALGFGPEGGALAGSWNRLATVRGGKVNSLVMDSLGGRTLTGLAMKGTDAVAVGQGGLVLVSRKSRGAKWDLAETGLPRQALASFDLNAVSLAGATIRAVGRPGSAVLASDDMGKTWRIQHTGQPMPLHGVHFRDALNGWAVGELGTILATRDGGKTWVAQQRGGQRMAVLSIHGQPGRACLDVVSLLGGHEGYLTAGLCVGSPEPSSASLLKAGEGCRYEEAFRQSGGASAAQMWQFPVASHLSRTSRQDLLAAWDKLHGGRAASQLLAALVLAIRTHQPEIVLTTGTGDALDGILEEAITQAFKVAGDEKTCPEQLQTLGLKVWKPRKAYALAKDGPVELDQTIVSPRLGTSLREYATGPAQLLGARPASDRAFKLLAADLTGASSHRSLMQGLVLAPGGVARRPLPAVEDLDAATLKGVRERTRLWAMAERPHSPLARPDLLLSQLGENLRGMPENAAARVAHGLGKLYASKGQWSLAREAFALLAHRYPAHPLSADALRWLVLHQCSGEVRRRYQQGQFVVLSSMETIIGEKKPAAVFKPVMGGKEKGPKLPDLPTFKQQTLRDVSTITGQDDTRKWLQTAVGMEKQLAGFGPLHVADPRLGFSIQSARRRLGDIDGSRKWLRGFASRQPAGPWREVALSELWLVNRTGPAPRPVLLATPTEKRPYLDGKLDEECWQGARPLVMQDAGGGSRSSHPTQVSMIYDRDFLYLGVRCAFAAKTVAPPSVKRTRDGDLRANDRVSLMLDVDRDYSTCFHLQADERGCVSEDCWGDKSWNPRWFVAVHRTATAWTLEAAIPRSSLCEDNVSAGQAWAMNVIRTVPGKGVQALSLPAEAPETAHRTEGMGLLLFTLNPRATAERK